MKLFFSLILATSLAWGQTGASQVSTKQTGTGAIMNNVQSKVNQFVNVMDYGAKCNGGTTDDRVAIQAAIDAVGIGSLYFPAPGCGVSYPGLYLYPPNAGMSLIGQAQIQPGVYVKGTGGGLVAYRATAPTSVNISTCSATGTLATCTTSAPHGLTSGIRTTVNEIVNAAPVTFHGSGLNDATESGTFTGTRSTLFGTGSGVFVVRVSATGTPDSFTWSINHGTISAPVTMTGAAQTLSNGIQITFAATTGHTLGAYWVISPSDFNMADGLIKVVDSTHFSYYLPQAPTGAYISGGGVIKAWSLLTDYAISGHLVNMYLDGNSLTGVIGSGVATHGFVDAGGQDMEWHGLTARLFSGDGAQVFNEYTPVTTITGSVVIGGTSIAVTSITNNRLTFGDTYCTGVMLDYGQPTQEGFGISSVVGSTINISGTFAFNHNSGTSTAQCHANANNLKNFSYTSYANGGWAFRIIPSSDNNGFNWFHHTSNNNGLGGENWFGTVQTYFTGSYNGDNGPPVQLGDYVSLSGLVFSTFYAPGGIEEAANQWRAIVVACASSNEVFFKAATGFVTNSANSPNCLISGNIAHGPNGAAGEFDMVNDLGVIILSPTSTAPSGSALRGLMFTDLLNNLQGQMAPSAVSTHGLSVRKDLSNACNNDWQFEVSGFSDPSRMLGFGVDTANGATCIQGTQFGTGVYPLTLNPKGGAVGIGSAASPVPTYANNAAAISGGLVVGQIYRITGTDTPGIVH